MNNSNFNNILIYKRGLKSIKKSIFKRIPIQENTSREHFLLNRMAYPWKNFPKGIALSHLVNSFKRKPNFFLNEVARNTYINL